MQIAGTTFIYLVVIYPLRNDSLLAVCQTGSGELKTKPTQMSVRELRGLGLAPDLVSSHFKLFDNAHLDYNTNGARARLDCSHYEHIEPQMPSRRA